MPVLRACGVLAAARMRQGSASWLESSPYVAVSISLGVSCLWVSLSQEPYCLGPVSGPLFLLTLMYNNVVT